MFLETPQSQENLRLPYSGVDPAWVTHGSTLTTGMVLTTQLYFPLLQSGLHGAYFTGLLRSVSDL